VTVDGEQTLAVVVAVEAMLIEVSVLLVPVLCGLVDEPAFGETDVLSEVEVGAEGDPLVMLVGEETVDEVAALPDPLVELVAGELEDEVGDDALGTEVDIAGAPVDEE